MSEQNCTVRKVPAYKVWSKFPYLLESKDLTEKTNVGEHVHFQKLLPQVKEKDYIRLVHMYDIMPLNEPIVQSVGPFLLDKLKAYPGLEKLTEYINALIADDSSHYDLEHEACKTITELPADIRSCFRFLRKVAKLEYFTNTEIDDFANVLSPSSGPLWANFHRKMLELYLAHDDNYMF